MGLGCPKDMIPLKYVDEYFYSIYKQMKEDGVDNIDLIFDFDFQTHTKLFKEK